MHMPVFEFRTTEMPTEAGVLSMLVQPGYIVLDLGPDDLEDPDERRFIVVADERLAGKLMRAILDLGVENYAFVPSLRKIDYEDVELSTIEVNGPSGYIEAVVAASERLKLKNLRDRAHPALSSQEQTGALRTIGR